jgi:nitroimidazol reductase NimA-like FMN-containing flavoprotein (pyridoxamine 5'-phosphate oxidase superfamily)
MLSITFSSRTVKMADNDLVTIAQRRDFVCDNHTCVVSYARKVSPPSMSIVHYVMDDDKIVFLTMADRQKTKAVKRNEQLSICVLAGPQGGLSWPPEYLVVDGTAEIISDMDYVVARAMEVGPIMTGQPVPQEAKPMVREMMVRENRVAICVAPQSSFHSPSVHPEEDGVEDMVHGLGARLPWAE